MQTMKAIANRQSCRSYKKEQPVSLLQRCMYRGENGFSSYRFRSRKCYSWGSTIGEIAKLP
jgi:hypothetical protein